MASAVPIVPFAPTDPVAVRVEVQRLDAENAVLGMGRHAHRFLEFVLIDHAGGAHEVTGVDSRVAAGDLWALAPGEAHDLSALGRAEGWLLLFCADAVDPLSSDASPWRADPRWGAFLRSAPVGQAGHVRLSRDDRERWERELADLRAELARPGPGHADAVAARLTLLLLGAARIASDQHPQGTGARTSSDPFVLAVLAALEQEFHQSLPLQRIARSVGRTPAHASELMRERTGLTIGQWITERRLAEARRQLAQSDDPVADVGQRVGYLDATHFIRHFKRAYGLTPAAWRRAHRRPGNPPTDAGILL